MLCAFCRICLWEGQIAHVCVHEVDLEISAVCDISYAGVLESVLSQDLEKLGKLGVKER